MSKRDEKSKDGMTNLNEDMNFHKHDEKSFKRIKSVYESDKPKDKQKFKNAVKTGNFEELDED